MTNPLPEVELTNELMRLAASFPSPRLAVLSALRFALAAERDTAEVVRGVAQACQLDEASVHELIAAYPTLRARPPRAAVCSGLSCWLRGARSILARPENFGLEPGPVEAAACLGYCFSAPVVRDADGILRQGVFQASTGNPDGTSTLRDCGDPRRS